MKNKMFFLGIIVCILCIINSVNVYAILFELNITGDKTVEIDKTIQLKAEFRVGNDILIPDKPNGGIRECSREDVTNQSSWTSSNNDIAVVDNNGKVKGVAEGKTTITATYNGQRADYEINVKPKSVSTIMIIGIIVLVLILISIAIIICKKNKKNKNIK